jgi:hypothetical protein
LDLLEVGFDETVCVGCTDDENVEDERYEVELTVTVVVLVVLLVSDAVVAVVLVVLVSFVEV